MADTTKRVRIEVPVKVTGADRARKDLSRLTADMERARKVIDKDERKGILTRKQANVARGKLARTELNNKLQLTKAQANIDSKAAMLQMKIDSALAMNSVKQDIRSSNIQQRQLEREAQLEIKNKALIDKSNELGMSVYETNKGMKQSGYTFDKNGTLTDIAGQSLDQLGKSQKQVNFEIKDAAVKGRRFQAEMLSMMFAGMALKRSLDGVVQSSLELWGVTELTSAAFDITMIPVMETITPMIYDLLGGFMDLPESVQMGIGSLIGFGWVLGNLISGLAMSGLAWESFMKFFPETAAGIQGMIGKAGGISGILGKAVALGVTLKWGGDAIEGLNEGNLTQSIGSSLQMGGAIWALASPKNYGKGLAIIGIGAGIDLMGVAYKDGLGAFQSSLGEKMMEGGFFLVPGYGWAVGLTVVVSGFIIKNAEKIRNALEGEGFIMNQEKNANYGMGSTEEIAKTSLEQAGGNELMAGMNAAENAFNSGAGITPAPSLFRRLIQNPIKDWFSGFGGGDSSNIFSGSMDDGIITPSGVISTAPDDYIIATKDPQGLGGGAKGVNMNVTYNITVQDKRELERILRENNNKLTEDVRRLVTV